MQVQRLEGYGEQLKSQREQDRLETLYGMDMSRVTAANEAKQKANAQMWEGIGSAAGTLASGASFNSATGKWDFKGSGR